MSNTSYNYLAVIQGGEGPDVWDKELTINAVDFKDAASQANAKAEDLGGWVVTLDIYGTRERDALAAHCARLREALSGPITTIMYDVKQGGVLGEMLQDEINKALAEAPAASLDAVIGPTVELLTTALEIGKEKYHYIGFVKSQVEAELTRLQKLLQKP